MKQTSIYLLWVSSKSSKQSARRICKSSKHWIGLVIGLLVWTMPHLAAAADYVGAEHFLYASDIPHWDNEFPGNLKHLRGHKELSEDAKQKILYKNAKQLFGL